MRNEEKTGWSEDEGKKENVKCKAWPRYSFYPAICPRSLSDLSNRSEPSGRARADFLNFEAHSETMQRKIEEIWAVIPLAQ